MIEFVLMITLIAAVLSLMPACGTMKTHNEALLSDYGDSLRLRKASEPLGEAEPDFSVLTSLVDEDIAAELTSAFQMKSQVGGRIRDMDEQQLADELDEAEMRLGFSQHIKTTGRYSGGDMGNEVVFVRTDANPKKRIPEVIFSLAPLLPFVPVLAWAVDAALLLVLLGLVAKYRGLKEFNAWLLGKKTHYHVIGEIASYRFRSAGCQPAEVLRLLPPTSEFAVLIKDIREKEGELNEKARWVGLDDFGQKEVFRSEFRDWLDAEYVRRGMALKSAIGVLASQDGQYQTTGAVIMRTHHPKNPDDRFKEVFGMFPTFPSKKAKKHE